MTNLTVKGSYGCRERSQKRFVPRNSGGALRNFEEITPIGLAKFAELLPKGCRLAGADETHYLCVCTKQ